MLISARRHRLALGVAATGAALALAACGTDDPNPAEQEIAAAEDVEEEEESAEPDNGDFREGPVPDQAPEADEADLPPEPASDAPLGEILGWDGIERVSSFAKVADPDATADCPEIEGEEGESATCTITYLGEELEYSINVQSGGFMLNYTWELSGAPLQRDIVEDTLRVRAETEQVRCDMDEVILVAPGDDDVASCEALVDDTTRDYSVSIGDVGTLSVYQV
ncbi:hypothetical protein [Nocardiopsis metallicus]|uniref:DUF4333 domain-containing protein n=1 Tax=Nocardiopsis metallicus TaxID=179819 RepID=A0A840WBF6_9ACTN|nr:hypothetical protein [Nocardiopsis metallicus]MBB5493462.1 hypothetical protein [Nocardiopsis metallicus]